MEGDQLLLTVPETARLLRISRNLAYELVARGDLPAVRLGRAIRVPRRSLDDWVRASVAAGAGPGERSKSERTF